MNRAKDINERTPWQDLTPGGEIYEPGTARLFNTGIWRTDTPVFNPEACKHCMLCVPFCPDSSIPVQPGKLQNKKDLTEILVAHGIPYVERTDPIGNFRDLHTKSHKAAVGLEAVVIPPDRRLRAASVW